MHDLPYCPLLCQQPDTFLLQPQKCWKRNQNIFLLLNHLHQSPSIIFWLVQLILQFVLQFCCLVWHWWATSNFLGKQTSTPAAKLHLGKALNICLREGKVTGTLQNFITAKLKGNLLMGFNIMSFSSNSKMICTRLIKSCFNMPTFAQDHQGVYPMGEFFQWEVGRFSSFVLGGSLWGLMGFVLQVHPQGHREEKDCSRAKI